MVYSNLLCVVPPKELTARFSGKSQYRTERRVKSEWGFGREGEKEREKGVGSCKVLIRAGNFD